MAKKDRLFQVEFDEAAMIKKLKKLSKVYGEGQRQGVKRWGVQTCRELAQYTQVYVKKGKGESKKARDTQKRAMLRDGLRLFIVHENGDYKRSPNIPTLGVVTIKGKQFAIDSKRYIRDAGGVDRIIQQNRLTKPTSSGKHLVFVKWLRGKDKYVCSRRVMDQAINQRYRRLAGMAKDGWIDAGNDIGKGQKGKGQMKIAASFLKTIRKSRVSGYATESKKLFKSSAFIINNLPYVSTAHVLSNSNKKKALKDGIKNTLKWYEQTIRAENKKKK
tara:strand:- start:251 stop:1072 length:822 start_codon:yes stop_codon:yes gene_type:complete